MRIKIDFSKAFDILNKNFNLYLEEKDRYYFSDENGNSIILSKEGIDIDDPSVVEGLF